MTLTVTLTAQQGQGVDFNDYLTQHFANFVPHGMPMFNAASDSEETTQIVHLATPETGAESDTRLVALEGQDFTYTFSNHTISGTIETIRLGAAAAIQAARTPAAIESAECHDVGSLTQRAAGWAPPAAAIDAACRLARSPATATRLPVVTRANTS